MSRKTDIVEAKKELVLACILGGIAGFRGLPNPVFKRHLRNLRMLVSLDPMVPASEWNAAAKKCWPRELEGLKDLRRENERERGARLIAQHRRRLRPGVDANPMLSNPEFPWESVSGNDAQALRWDLHLSDCKN